MGKQNIGGFVKITGGEFSGRRIRTPGGSTHPMGERERIALFNIIMDRIQGKRVVDLYCGGGTLAIEALSRGAKSVIGVDTDKEALNVMKDNLKELGVQGEVLRSNVAKFIEETKEQFDLVMADPPYDKYADEMVKNLGNLVSDGGILVLSHPNKSPEIEGMKLEDSRKYAGAHLSFYVKD